ncbi:MAG: ATP-binding protein [Deltaproteobacteria bacterium]|nr:ATP-binding protein [Deltaproteobacteria bacterium]
MDRGRLKASIDEWRAWHERALAAMKPRRDVPRLSKGHALGLLGVRRAGKTWLAVAAARRSGLRTLYYNFEDPLFYAEPRVDGIDTLLSVHAEFAGAEPELLVFDELQNIDGWERWARKTVDTGRYRLIVTGSSARLLSAELATAIAGRVLAQTVWPLGFAEYLEFAGVSCASPAEYVGATRAYLRWGGLPEIALAGDDVERGRILRQYVDDILLKDVISRHGIRSPRRLFQVVAYATTNAACLFSHNRVKGAFGVDVQTSQEYFGYLEEAFLVFAVPRYHPNLKVQARDPQKLYVVDTGLRNAFSRSASDDIGRMAENAVYVELRRRGHDVTYWRDAAHEVDFVLRDGPRPVGALQVTWSSLEQGAVRDREVAGLVACLEALGLTEGTILTLDRDERLEVRGRRVLIRPIWQFLSGE